MNTRRYLNWPFCGLVLYLVALLVSGLVYASVQRKQPDLHLTGVTPLAHQTNKTEISIRGFGLNKSLHAYLALDAANRRAIVGNLPIWGQAVDVKIMEDKAYVLNLEEGTKIFDLSLPVEPVQIGRIKGKAQAWRGDIGKGRIYLSSMARGIAVCSLARKDLIYQVDTYGRSFASLHRDQRLFVADGKAGVSIFDVSSRIEARLLSRVPLPGTTVDLAFAGDYLLAVSRSGGLHLIDIHNPKSPRLLQSVSTPKGYVKVTVVDNLIYVTDVRQKIDIFSIGADHKLIYQTSFPTFGKVRDFLRQGDRLYIAESSYGVSALDISDPLQPRRIGYVGTPGDPVGLALYGDYLYVASSSQGVQIIDVRRFVSHKLLATLDTPGVAYDLVLDGRWIFVADGEAGLQIVERTKAGQLRLMTNLPTGTRATSLVKSKDMLFLAVNDQGLLVIDVRNPMLPQLIARLKLAANLSDLAIRGTDLFASTLKKKLLRIDVTDPFHPWVAESLELPGRARRIALAGDDVFIAAEKAGLQIARFVPGVPGKLISGLSRPWPMNNFATALDIVVRQGYAYLVQGDEGLQVVDVHNPLQPREVKILNIPGRGLGLGLADQFVVLSSRWNGYFFIDTRRPSTPFLAANIYHPRSTSNFRIEANKLYALGRTNGIGVIPLPLGKVDISGTADLSIAFKTPPQAGWYDLSVSDGTKLETARAAIEIK